jgi:L-malate glycosyltransferase
MKTVTKDNKILNILVINYEFPPVGGGGGVASYNISKELAKRHKVDLLTSYYKGLPKEEVVDGITVYRTKVLKRDQLSAASLPSLLTFPISGFFSAIKLMRRKKYDVISTHFAIPTGPLGVILSKIFKVPNILSVYGGDIYDPSKKMSPHKNIILKNVVKWVLEKSDVVIAESKNIKDYTEKYYFPRKKIDLIPLGFCPHGFERKTRAELGLKENCFYFSTLGRLVKRKGYDYLLDAFKILLQKQRGEMKIILMGAGPEEDNLRNQVKCLGIEKDIIFKGFVSDDEKYQYHSVADCYVLSSLHEGFGIMLHEAMFCGLPIVATNYGGQIDFLKEEKNAFLVSAKNSQVLAEAMQKIILNESLRKKMADNNKEDLKQYYIENITKRYEDIMLTESKRSFLSNNKNHSDNKNLFVSENE